jgi:hypothetical protein
MQGYDIGVPVPLAQLAEDERLKQKKPGAMARLA